ncbi:UNVERIFIED_CONTAM: hypothetical protein Sradi_3752800 [Sesamum radiatum]|uniref:Uncharacterized protein n=1 Tax=Sesamum radiatum TaxID=300843 RepID=A0AAW2PYZ6_SESRA
MDPLGLTCYTVPPRQQVEGRVNIVDPAAMHVAVNFLLAEQLRQLIMETVCAALRGSQDGGTGHLSQ